MGTLRYSITEDDHKKALTSEYYNYVYNKDLNVLLRWGVNTKDNPMWSPFGPDYIIVDIEGMSMELFSVVVGTLNANRTITTVNLLKGLVEPCDNYAMQYCINQGVVPLFNLNSETIEEAGFFSAYVNNEGIVSPVSSYPGGIDILDIDNLLTDLWNSELFMTYRWEQLNNRNKNN